MWPNKLHLHPRNGMTRIKHPTGVVSLVRESPSGSFPHYLSHQVTTRMRRGLPVRKKKGHLFVCLAFKGDPTKKEKKTACASLLPHTPAAIGDLGLHACLLLPPLPSLWIRRLPISGARSPHQTPGPFTPHAFDGRRARSARVRFVAALRRRRSLSAHSRDSELAELSSRQALRVPHFSGWRR